MPVLCFVKVNVAMSGETDNGLTFGASIGIRAGHDVDLDAGDLGKATNNDGNALSATDMGAIYVSGGFGKLSFKSEGIDNIHNDGFSHDVMYEKTFGAVAFTATADITGASGQGDHFAVKVVYTAGPATFTLAADDSSEADVTFAYAINDMITASINHDTDGQGTDSETIVKVAYSNNGLTAHLALADDDDDQWELGLGYAANGLSIAAVFAENDGATPAGTEADLTASYDLGGGMSINAATNESGAWFIGSKMTF